MEPSTQNMVLDALETEIDKTKALLHDQETGLCSWHMMLGARLQALANAIAQTGIKPQ